MIIVIFFLVIAIFFLALTYFVARIESRHNKELSKILNDLIEALKNDTVKWK